MAESVELGGDASVVPGRVLGRHLDHQRADHRGRGWSAATAGGVGPVAGDASSLSAGRLVCRCSTASWWCKAMISRSLARPNGR